MQTFAYVPAVPGPVREVFVGEKLFPMHPTLVRQWYSAPSGTAQGYVFDGSDFSEPAGPNQDELWNAHRSLAKAALQRSDLVANRCFKSGIAFPDDWRTYVTALRAIASASSGDPTQAFPVTPIYPVES